jgi:hypothetical protein
VKSKPFPHEFSGQFKVDSYGTKFLINFWHLATFRGGHSMRFSVKGHAFEVYFSQGGRVVHVFPVNKKGYAEADK